MDFVNRGTQPSQPSSAQHSPVSGSPKSRRKSGALGWLQISSVTLLFSIVILVVAVVGYLMFSNGAQESKYVDSKKIQAVFLNGGQVYFGNVQSLNNKYLALGGIYYLRVNQQVQPKSSKTSANNNVSLVKLGCELHGPTDQMVINRDQIIFWENLKTDGQVAKAIATFQKDNPNGQNCQAANSSTTPTTGNGTGQ